MIFSSVIAICLGLGLWLLLQGLVRMRQRPWRGVLRASNGCGMAALAAVVWLVAANLQTYQRLTAEQVVADLTFQQLGPQQFAVTLADVDGTVSEYVLRGDEWQLDARILKWKGPAIIAGMNTRYRLERLSGRYRDIRAEYVNERTLVSLVPKTDLERWGWDGWSPDIWGLAEAYPRWLPLVDAVYGNATYLRMVDGAEYRVSVTSSGLIARAKPAML